MKFALAFFPKLAAIGKEIAQFFEPICFLRCLISIHLLQDREVEVFIEQKAKTPR